MTKNFIRVHCIYFRSLSVPVNEANVLMMETLFRSKAKKVMTKMKIMHHQSNTPHQNENAQNILFYTGFSMNWFLLRFFKFWAHFFVSNVRLFAMLC